MATKSKTKKRGALESIGVINKLLARSVEQRAIAADIVEFERANLVELSLAQNPSKSLVKRAEEALETASKTLAYFDENSRTLQKKLASAMKSIETTKA